MSEPYNVGQEIEASLAIQAVRPLNDSYRTCSHFSESWAGIQRVRLAGKIRVDNVSRFESFAPVFQMEMITNSDQYETVERCDVRCG